MSGRQLGEQPRSRYRLPVSKPAVGGGAPRASTGSPTGCLPGGVAGGNSPFSWYSHRLTPLEGPRWCPPGLPPGRPLLRAATSLIFHTCLFTSPAPGCASTVQWSAPGRAWCLPPHTDVRGPSGTPTVGARRYWWPPVASAVGICGLLTVGYPSIADSGGYGRCGFRPVGVSRRSASSWSSMCQPQRAPHGAPRVPVADLALGNSVGATWMASGALPVRRRRPRRVGCISRPFHDIPAPPSRGRRPGLLGGPR